MHSTTWLSKETRVGVFPCRRVLPQPSRVLAVTLPRPVGVVFEEDARRGRVVVAGFVEGSPADKRAKVGSPLD